MRRDGYAGLAATVTGRRTMDVYGQFVIAELDKTGSMFDFQVTFFIRDPRSSSIQAFYHFDKRSKAPRGVDPDKLPKEQIQVFKGPMDADVNERKPFKFASMTGKGVGRGVDAQVGLESSRGSEKFRIRVQLTKTKSHSVDITFDGEKPSWLPDDGSMFPGQLMLLKVKDLDADKKPW
jgi:hypothetical protein